MKVFLPANTGQLEEKKEWLQSNICKKLSRKGVKFGFEIKGAIGAQGVKTNLPFGIHLPYCFVNSIRRLDSRKLAGLLICEIENLNPKPDYIVLHGMELGNDKDLPSKEKRYVLRFGADEYERAFKNTVDVVRELIAFFRDHSVKVAIENTPLTDMDQPYENILQGKNTPPVLETHLRMRIGSLSKDLLALARETNCEIVHDLEHSAFALDFMCRCGSYSDLKTAEVPCELTVREKSLAEKCGIIIREGFAPSATFFPGIIEEEVEALRAKIYHITGSCQCGKWHELCNGKVAVHSPIIADDKNLARMMKFIKRIQPDEDLLFVLENDIPASKHPEMWTARSPNAQKESLEIFCQMLLDIWYK